MRDPDERSLSALFAPPRDDLYGTSGILCGYSADPTFLEAALRRFSRVSPASRRVRGSLDWTLLLDPDHPVMSAAIVPGLIQLHPVLRADRPQAFKCMHAKVALLGFGPSRTGDATVFRIIVSTGNWTTESARHQIELVWSLDTEVDGADESGRHELWAAARFFTTLLGSYQHGRPLTTRAEALLASATARGRPPASRDDLRFIATLPLLEDDVATPLWPQIAGRIARGGRKSNFVVCGSGSFERAANASGVSLLDYLVQTLQAKGAMTQIPERRVAANLDPSHRVVADAINGSLVGWELRRPRDPGARQAPRTVLHAKYLLTAQHRGGDLANTMLYLGSGNLSWPGMVLGGAEGNVEAGVVLSTPELDSVAKVERRLPMGPRYTLSELKDGERVSLEEELPAQVEVPPPPILVFIAAGDGRVTAKWDLSHSAGESVEVELLLPGRTVLVHRSTVAIDVGSKELPRCFEIRWSGHEYAIPCVTDDGDFGRRVSRPASFEQWLEELLDFPATFNDPAAGADDDEDDGNEDREESAVVPRWSTGVERRRFPAHTALLLVERIADRNGTIPEAQATDWLNQLRDALLSRVPEAELDGWRQLGVDFLAALKSPAGFAPDWKDATAYAALIDDVNRAWRIDTTVRLEPRDD